MATFVPYASCYGNKHAVQLLGRNSYFSLFANPPCLISHRQRLACPAPEMTLRQITQLIRILRQLNLRDAKGNQLPNPQRLQLPVNRRVDDVLSEAWFSRLGCQTRQDTVLEGKKARTKLSEIKLYRQAAAQGAARAVPPQNRSSPEPQTSTACPASSHVEILARRELDKEPDSRETNMRERD